MSYLDPQTERILRELAALCLATDGDGAETARCQFVGRMLASLVPTSSEQPWRSDLKAAEQRGDA